MHVLSTLAQKGGSGKTVLATNLARVFQLAGLEVRIIDSDPQGSATDWANTSDQHEMPTTLGVDGPVVHEQLPQLSGVDLAIVDGAGKIDGMSESIVKASDLVLIPVHPAAVEMWALGEMVDLVLSHQKRTGRPQGAFVISRATHGTTLVDSARETLRALELPLLSSATYRRVAYVRAMNQGVSVMEMDDAKAQAEIEGIATELESMITAL